MKAWHIIVLIASGVLFGFVTQPMGEDVKSLKNQTSKLSEEIQTINTQLQEITRIQREEQNQQQELARRIPLQNQQENLIRDIQSIRTKSGFGYESISFRKGKNPVLGLPELKISFSTEGNKQNLLSFLELIEENERFLGMENLSITTRQEGSTPVVSFSVSLYAFYQQD